MCNSGWTVEKVRAFVESLLPHIHALSPAERFVVFQQSGLLDMYGKARSFVRALATGRLPQEELEKFVAGEPSLVDGLTADDSVTLEDLQGSDAAELVVDAPTPTAAEAPEEQALPLVQTRDALAVLDHTLVASADEEAAGFLVASAGGKLWRHAYRDAPAAVAQAQANHGGVYAAKVRDTFLREYEAATSLALPEGYAFKVEGRVTPPNLMQRLVAVRVREQRRFGNWSGTGAGKTLSAILATRVVGANLTVICCPNAVVDGWARSIGSIFPGSEVAQKSWTPAWKGPGPRYLVMNYEQFQQPDSEASLKALLTREQVDFVVIDEIHYAKQRDPESMSQRKRLVMGLVAGAAEKYPELCVLGMSATPVINNLQEGRSLIELVTGLEHEELETRATVANCMRLYQRLVTLGTRWKPDYTPQLEVEEVHVDCTSQLDAIRALGPTPGPLELERILTEVRLPAILDQLKPGRRTLIYTHYVEGIDKLLYDAVTSAGRRAGFCTGDDKSGLEAFKRGELDVLIGSSAIGTGVDGLQYVCDQLVINALPWTHAEYEQLVGRLYRQGQRSARVRVVIPTTFATVNGERWSYCDSKLARIRYKKSIADAAVDGEVPEGSLRSPAQAQADILAWLERLDRGETSHVARRPITVPLDGSDPGVERHRLAKYGDFSAMNARWNSAASSTTARRLAADPEEWERYHTLYRAARQTWAVVPYEDFIAWAKRRKGLVIGDFGCGEALVAAGLGDLHVVHSFDHVAINGRVVPGDMTKTPLADDTLDVALFSLSLMGTNFTDYLREAYRTLKLDGWVHIYEATSRFSDLAGFEQGLRDLGFGNIEHRDVWTFTHISARKSEHAPRNGATVNL
jgi:superfamily II DNA or RNA helicase